MREFKRNISKYLTIWQTKPNRKPLILRGARQVGKSFVIRRFGQDHFRHVLEVNLERTPELASLLTKNTPQRALQLLEVQYNVPVIPGETLLFIDEIQAAPEVLGALRYFYEDLPNLHIIAAGSLLDFVLAEHEISVPVGRIEYAYLGPATFSEFLAAVGESALVHYLQSYELPAGNRKGEVGAEEESIPTALHQKALQLLRTYILVGGMPEAVATYTTTGSFVAVETVKSSLFTSIRDDFSKYQRRVDVAALRKVFERIPRLVGRRIKYVEIDRELRSKKIAETLELLSYSRVISKVRHSSSNGIPLGAEASDTIFKLLLLDVGLLSTACQIAPAELESAAELDLVNKGAIAEQFIGQHLLYRGAPFDEPSLFYWQREDRNSSAEIDYVISRNAALLPVEVKAGKEGTLRSLHYFMAEKKAPLGVKFDSQKPRVFCGDAPLADGSRVPYKLLSLPLYLVEEMDRIVSAL